VNVSVVEGVIELILWLAIQVAILVYIAIGLRLTRAGIRHLVRRDGDAYEIGREKFRSQAWRGTAVIGYLVIGALIALRLKGLMVPLAIVLLYGEIILLRNQRNDVRQVRRMAERAAAEDDDDA
jgi:hypothetical protein